MAVPSDPVVSDIILQGMQEAGRFSVTTTAHADYISFLAKQWPTIKTEIWNACRTDQLLEVETLLPAVRGAHNLVLPSDFDNEIQLTLYNYSDEWKDLAQSATSSTITLASDFSAEAEQVRGHFIFIVSGTGSGFYRLISDYNDSTKVLTPSSAWSVTPDSTSEYVIGYYPVVLDRRDYKLPTINASRPQYYSRIGSLLYIYPTPDKVYPVVMTYRSNLTRLDEVGTTFVKHLRERRHLWVQGVKVKTMARYDEERYPAEKQIWEQMLRQYAGQNVVYSQMKASR